MILYKKYIESKVIHVVDIEPIKQWDAKL